MGTALTAEMTRSRVCWSTRRKNRLGDVLMIQVISEAWWRSRTRHGVRECLMGESWIVCLQVSCWRLLVSYRSSVILCGCFLFSRPCSPSPLGRMPPETDQLAAEKQVVGLHRGHVFWKEAALVFCHRLQAEIGVVFQKDEYLVEAEKDISCD